jgi:hypothetical protein
MMLAIGLLYMAFIMLRYIPSIPSFISAFIKKGCCIFPLLLFYHFYIYLHVYTLFVPHPPQSLRLLYFVRTFFCIHWEDHVIFVFASVNMLYCIYWFVYVEPSLHS